MTPKAPQPVLLTRSQRVRAIVAASSGNLVEWFDFYTYAFCSIYFAGAFFPKGDATAQLLQTAGVFALGFFMRPLGGWFLGRLADRRGRRHAMMVSIVMMCGGSLAVACLPAYADIGVAAPVGLLLARLLQGLSVGGEYGTSATYMSEIGVRGQRGFSASFHYVTLIGGQLAALLVMVIVEACFDDAQLRAWAWRVPFALGAAAAATSLFLRQSLPETAAELKVIDPDAGSLRALWPYRKAFVTVMGYTAGGSLAFYTCTTYMQKYLVNSVGFATRTATTVMTCCICLFMVVQPLFGALSDRIGRRRMMLIFGLTSTTGIYPLMTGLRHVTSPWTAALCIAAALCCVSCYTSIAGLIKAEVFPSRVRALGVGLSYALANAVFGGSAEYAALALKASGQEETFFIYASCVSAAGLICARAIPDAKLSLLETQAG